ncbi:uncharacterized protein KY384_001174 [Bacidia gigantensis]|uniref:uncharacterized protein n=1 Tax=Bacidia gigantensis TaxID=2732470 RepID=UPI001D046073|nr:uncharacterized protein KY384_001174 [Bacidia gigantensis]KAG8534330.1 hypothetical protein KY384_001174 [Bacidia gigantensis]
MKTDCASEVYEPLMGNHVNMFPDATSQVQEPTAKNCGAPQKWWMSLSLGLNLSLFAFALVLLATDKAHSHTTNWYLQQLSFYSPVFERLNFGTVDKTVDGSLFNEHSLLLRRAPSAEVDAAWEALADIGIVTITTNEVLRLGKNPNNTVKAPPEWGYGTDAHLAQLDGQHALHCLNAVRKYAYREHYYPGFYIPDPNSNLSLNSRPNQNKPQTTYPGQKEFPAIHQAHLSHCLHLLLQTLTCNPSTDMITHNWVRTQEYPFPDFGIRKKCRDHEGILKWQGRNKLSEEQWVEMAKRGPGEGVGEQVVDMEGMLGAWVEEQKKGEGGKGQAHG